MFCSATPTLKNRFGNRSANGSPTVKPYFWTELAQNAQAVWVAVAISGEGLALHDSPRATVNIAGGVNAPVNRALFPRALD